MPDTEKQDGRFWDIRSALLVAALGQIAALRLALTDWTPFLNITQTLIFLSILLGLALGYSSFTPRLTRWLGFIYGLIIIPAQLLRAVARTDLLYQDLGVIFLRVLDSLTLFIQNQPVYDTLLFITFVSLGFWYIGLFTGYQLTRRQNFLGAVLPAGSVMLIVQVYDSWASARTWFLAAYIFIALILLGRLYFLQSRDAWRAKHVFFTYDVEGDISRTALAFAAIVVFAAWIFPSVLSSIAPAAQAWTEFTQPVRQRLSDAISALDSPYKAAINGDFYGSDLALGSSAPISDTPVFYVTVDHISFEPARYYWRGRVYDRYSNGLWGNSESTRKNFEPDLDQLQIGELSTRDEARFTFRLNFPKQELIYAPSEMIWTDRPSRLLMADPVDVSAWLASPGMAAGDSYQARSLVANPSVAELRAAGGEYPQWVKSRYLEIPPELAPSLKELAERVTANQKTPYDKAQAITVFLRKEIEYTTKLTDAPADGQDPVMWVLLEYKKGFCMYSASAEVLMLRSLGIPARLAVGFAQGKFDPSKERYVVARLNSHAWPEVYFPNIGWVEFEPTGNQIQLERPREPIQPLVEEDTANPRNEPGATIDGATADAELFEQSLPENKNSLIFNFAARLFYPIIFLGLLVLVVFVIQRYAIVDRLPLYLEAQYIKSGRKPPNWLARWSIWAMLMPMQRAFHSIDVSLRWLGYSQPAHATPFERANVLAELLPSMRQEIMVLKEEHEFTLFTSRAGSLERARSAGRKILLETLRVLLKRSS